MSNNIFTNHFHTHVSKLFWNCIANNANTDYYMFAARNLDFPNDDVPPSPLTSYRAEHTEIHEEIVFGKKISSSDVTFMIGNNLWESGTAYAQYDDQDETLHSKNFFAIVYLSDEYLIYKCLKNNGGSASTVKPTQKITTSFVLSDGYEWKFMGSITEDYYAKFSTNSFSPINPSSNDAISIATSAISGAIDSYIVIDRGIDYRAYATGTIKEPLVGGNVKKFYIQSEDYTLSANTDFYKNSSLYISSGNGSGQLRKIEGYGTEGNNRYVLLDQAFVSVPDASSTFEIAPYVTIVGDGTGALAKPVINEIDYSIEDIIVIQRGEGYSWANIQIQSNTGISDSGTASARAVISPYGGHGSNIIDELYADAVGISSKFEGSVHPIDNTFRKFGILKNPRFNSLVITVDTVTSFASETSVTQPSTGASGDIVNVDIPTSTITLENVFGIFATGAENPIYGSNPDNTTFVTATNTDYTTFDARTIVNAVVTYNGSNNTGFLQNEKITQINNDNAYGYVHTVSGNTLYLNPMKGDFYTSGTDYIVGETSGATATITTYTKGQLVKGSGEFLYIENMQPITRAANQNELMKIVVEF